MVRSLADRTFYLGRALDVRRVQRVGAGVRRQRPLRVEVLRWVRGPDVLLFASLLRTPVNNFE